MSDQAAAKRQLFVGIALAAAWLFVIAPMRRQNASMRQELHAAAVARASVEPILLSCGGDPREALAALRVRAAAFDAWLAPPDAPAALFESLGDEAPRFEVFLDRVAPEQPRIEVLDRAAGVSATTTRAAVQFSGAWDAVRSFLRFIEESDAGFRVVQLRVVPGDRGVRADTVLMRQDLTTPLNRAQPPREALP